MKENAIIIAFAIGFFLCLYLIRDKDAPQERFPLSEKNKAMTPHVVIDKVIEVKLQDSLDNLESK